MTVSVTSRLAGLAVAVGLALPQAALAELVSHRALYRLDLAPERNRAGLVELHGALGLEWRAACGGSTSAQHLFFEATSGEGGNVRMDVRYSAFESADDRAMRFVVRSYDGGSLFEEFQGSAAIKHDSDGGDVRFTTPPDKVIDLPPGTIFPTRHLRELIAAASAGERMVTHTVFDGSGPDGLSQVTALIGPAADDGAQRERRWPVHLGYYRPASGDDLPDFEITFAVGDDGVLHDLRLDYGGFALIGELQRLELLTAQSCE
jgi:hypothetical protein